VNVHLIDWGYPPNSHNTTFWGLLIQGWHEISNSIGISIRITGYQQISTMHLDAVFGVSFPKWTVCVSPSSWALKVTIKPGRKTLFAIVNQHHFRAASSEIIICLKLTTRSPRALEVRGSKWIHSSQTSISMPAVAASKDEIWTNEHPKKQSVEAWF